MAVLLARLWLWWSWVYVVFFRFSSVLKSGIVRIMAGPDLADVREEIPRMQDGVKTWVQRMTRPGDGGLRKVSAPVLLSLLCASAFCPLLGVGVGITGAAAVAGINVLSSVGGGVLSGILASAVDRLRPHDAGSAPSQHDLEKGVAEQIQQALAAGDERAVALRSQIAAVLEEIGAAGTVLQAAIETGNERVHNDVIAAIDLLGNDFAELGFLIKDGARASAEIQKRLDEQGANTRVIMEQNYRQSTDIRLIGEKLTAIELRTRPDAVAGAAGPDRGVRWVHGNPYRGLLPFEEDDEEVFYGRARLTTELAVTLVRQMNRGGVIVVTGASGAGKSSLLRAGLLPTLARGMKVEGSQNWPRRTITPTNDPLSELATTLAELGGTEIVMIRDALARHPDQAHLSVRQAIVADAARRNQRQLPSGGNASRLVLIVDQFEQVFTLNPGSDGEAGRQAFITALCAAATKPVGPSGQPPALVVIAVRGDFWDRCAAYPELAHELQEGQFVVGPMSESELRLAITGPADAAGLRIDENLTDTIISDLHAADGDDAAGALPLLSQAMLLTCEHLDGNRLTSKGYELAGGVSGAVQTSADAVYKALSAEQQALAREILRNMTVASRDGRFTRRPVNLDDLYAGNPAIDRSQVDEVLEAFAAKRLIVLNDGTAQIAHDALLRAWPKLRGWLKDDQASWILYGQLADDAATWHDKDDDSSFLYRGTQLVSIWQAATRWSADPRRYPVLTSTEQDFLRASDRAVARSTRQRRAVSVVLVMLLIASLVGAGFAVQAARSADQQRREALSGQLAAQSEALDTTDPVGAAELAAAAWHIAPTATAHDSLLDALAQPDRGVLTDGSYLNAVAFSPDGKTLATADNVGTVRLWNIATDRQIGRPLKVARENLYVYSVAFSPDGNILATGSSDGTARLWDAATHQQIGAPMMAADDELVLAVAFSPDGKILATASEDGTARLWDVATHRQIGGPLTIGSPNDITSIVDAVAFSPDGTTLATGSWDGTARLWDVATHQQIGAPMTADTSYVSAVAFSPDGKMLATASFDGTARLWDVATHQQIGAPMTADTSYVHAVAFSPDGTTLATASNDGTARLWSIATHQQIGFPLTASDGGIVSAVAFSPDGTTLATGSWDGTARLWDLAADRPIGLPLTAGSTVSTVAFGPDGKILATASWDGTARLWNIATHRQIGGLLRIDRSSQPLTSFVNAVAFSPDGKILATASDDGTARLWDVATHQQIGAPMTADKDGVTAVAFSPDGKILATASGDGTARLWDVATHQQIGAPMTADKDGVTAVAFSPDGTTLATASGDGTARLWDVATHQQIGAPMTADKDGVTAVAFSPDGTTLATASGDGTARLWDVATHQQIGVPMTADKDGVTAVAFSPDGTTLATGSFDGSARLWDVATHQQIGAPLTADTSSLTGVPSFVSGVAFSPDGKILATASDDGTARLWDVAFPADLLNAVCAIAGDSSLTRAEWNADVQSEPFQQTCP